MVTIWGWTCLMFKAKGMLLRFQMLTHHRKHLWYWLTCKSFSGIWIWTSMSSDLEMLALPSFQQLHSLFNFIRIFFFPKTNFIKMANRVPDLWHNFYYYTFSCTFKKLLYYVYYWRSQKRLVREVAASFPYTGSNSLNQGVRN